MAETKVPLVTTKSKAPTVTVRLTKARQKCKVKMPEPNLKKVQKIGHVKDRGDSKQNAKLKVASLLI